MERVLCVAAAVSLAGCPSDDSGDETASGGTETSTNPTSTSSSTTAASGSTTDPTTEGTGSSTTDPTDATSSSGDPATTDATTTTGPGTGTGEPSTTGDSSTGNPNACDPVVPGQFNACVDGAGNVDNSLCNWMGSGSATGFIGCLNSGEQDGANVCMISGCKDDCDCFAPPATGNATVVCRETLEGGGTACVLDCGSGQTCPDGMECIGNACFHPAAE